MRKYLCGMCMKGHLLEREGPREATFGEDDNAKMVTVRVTYLECLVCGSVFYDDRADKAFREALKKSA